MARQAAIGQGVDPNLFMSLIAHESGWNPSIVSPVGAVGLGQLMPATAQSLGVSDPTDPVQNLRGAAHYLKQQLTAFGGSPKLALAAYNAGPAAVRKYGGIPPYAETQHYVQSVMGAVPNYAAGNPAVPTQPQPAVGGLPSNQPQALQAPQERNLFAGLPDLGLAHYLRQAGVSPIVTNNLNVSHALTAPTPVEVQSVRNQQQNFNATLDSPASGISPHAQAAVQLAEEYLGTPYVWGGESAKGFDCSGLLQYTWAKNGVNIPRTTYDQFLTGTPITKGSLQPGDAVFFKGSDSIQRGGKTLPGHVGMYIGHGQIIQAPHTGTTVQITPLSSMGGYMGARRYGAPKA
jgi:cell wall-associated NlpC family hydrolase